MKRVALITGASSYVGPSLARLLAARDHDLVLGDPTTELVAELEAVGAAVVAVGGTRDLSDPSSSLRLVQAALDRFGRIDSAASFAGAIVTGRFMKSTAADFERVMQGCMMAPYHFMQAVLPSMIERGEGQVLVITSASAARATPGAPLYSAARAGATHLVRNVAAEVARHRVQVNSLGTNMMDFPDFIRANGAEDPAVRAKIEAMVPLGRLGTMEEFASFCMPYVDGTSRFTTGQFTSYSGGWS
jgi:NAD(P)-dependent dehydrogenase (short-subunit alcohol dehydrogenase family)